MDFSKKRQSFGSAFLIGAFIVIIGCVLLQFFSFIIYPLTLPLGYNKCRKVEKSWLTDDLCVLNKEPKLKAYGFELTAKF